MLSYPKYMLRCICTSRWIFTFKCGRITLTQKPCIPRTIQCSEWTGVLYLLCMHLYILREEKSYIHVFPSNRCMDQNFVLVSSEKLYDC